MIMKQDTLNLYSKYSYFLLLLYDQRYSLFKTADEVLITEKFFDSYNWVISHHWNIKQYWKNYRKSRSRIIKKFNYEKFMILLRPRFCYNICTVVVSFIF